MRALFGSLRHLILGETWTIPAGVGLTLALALGLRAVLPDEAWQHAGGFAGLARDRDADLVAQ